jgi:hypothetical protein
MVTVGDFFKSQANACTPVSLTEGHFNLILITNSFSIWYEVGIPYPPPFFLVTLK